jgi:hypothetical protein
VVIKTKDACSTRDRSFIRASASASGKVRSESGFKIIKSSFLLTDKISSMSLAKDGFCKRLNDNNHIRQVSQAGLYVNGKN